jgi:hypothetical protein
MERRVVILTLFCICSGSILAAEKPSILLILADDMGWQDTSVAFGPERTAWNDRYRMPALERLAREGMKFTQAYACTVCSPSRVSLMTGQNEARHGVTQWTYLSGEEPSSDLAHPTLAPAAWNWNGLQPPAGQVSNLPHSVSVPTLPAIPSQAATDRSPRRLNVNHIDHKDYRVHGK